MKTPFYSINKSIIFNPTKEDISQYDLTFSEKHDKIICLAQILEAHDDNSYDTYILFEENNKTYCWYEYNNPGSLSFHTNIDESNLELFFSRLESYDSNDHFFQKTFYYMKQQELVDKIPKQSNKILKSKI